MLGVLELKNTLISMFKCLLLANLEFHFDDHLPIWKGSLNGLPDDLNLFIGGVPEDGRSVFFGSDSWFDSRSQQMIQESHFFRHFCGSVSMAMRNLLGLTNPF